MTVRFVERIRHARSQAKRSEIISPRRHDHRVSALRLA